MLELSYPDILEFEGLHTFFSRNVPTASRMVDQLHLVVKASLLHVNTNIKVKVTPKFITASEKRAQEIYIICLVNKKLQEENIESFETDRDLGNLIQLFQNMLVVHAVYVKYVYNPHFGRIYATLIFKNLLLAILTTRLI